MRRVKTRGFVAATLVAAALLGAAPAAAEHRRLEPPAADPGRPAAPDRHTFDVDVDIEVGGDGFRLGGRVFGPQGVWGAWLNGAKRRNGFALDGRVQAPGRATSFRLDADIVDWLWGRPVSRL